MNVKVIYISSIIMMLMELGFQISAIVTALKFAEIFLPMGVWTS